MVTANDCDCASRDDRDEAGSLCWGGRGLEGCAPFLDDVRGGSSRSGDDFRFRSNVDKASSLD